MVYYFSGTGNSRYVAETIARILGESIKFIPETDSSKENFPNDKTIFIFPIYSWGVPPIVINFINNLPSSFWETIKLRQSGIYCVMTCGDEVALAPEMFIKTIEKKECKVISIQSVIMPNNYVLLPGFDIDPKKIEDEKLLDAPRRIIQIAQTIIQQNPTIDVNRGKYAWLKTKLIYPLFKKWGINDKKWHYTVKCIQCGKCASVCPVKNIKMKNGHPLWGTRCVSCLGCFHICPVHAVEYGKETRKKGQYFFPIRNYKK